MVIIGTDDNAYQPHVNSLKIAGKIPGAWLVHIKDAVHAVMDPSTCEGIVLFTIPCVYSQPGGNYFSHFVT